MNQLILQTIALTAVSYGAMANDNDLVTNTSSLSFALNEKVRDITIESRGISSICGIDSPTYRTKDLTIAYMNGGTNIGYLESVAKLSQLAFNELIESTGIDKESELSKTKDGRWTVCYGADTIEKLYTKNSLRMNLPSHELTDNSFNLTKHNLFNLFQSSLLNNIPPDRPLPHWFLEATSANFAGGSSYDLNAWDLELFLMITKETPFGMRDETDEWSAMRAHKSVVNDDFNFTAAYLKSLEYLIDNGPMSDRDIIQLIKDAKSQDFDFYDEINKYAISTGTNFGELRSNLETYKLYIIDSWADTPWDSELY